ncbi:MAG: hypothetical protein H6868_04220 [Rhodospirillales bacterium]|nr:hypothetical protein [Rhodospirillales bacterium]
MMISSKPVVFCMLALLGVFVVFTPAQAAETYKQRLSDLKELSEQMTATVNATDKAMRALGGAPDAGIIRDIKKDLQGVRNTRGSLSRMDVHYDKFCDEPDPEAALGEAIQKMAEGSGPLKEHVRLLSSHTALLQKKAMETGKTAVEKAPRSKRTAEKQKELNEMVMTLGQQNNAIRAAVIGVSAGYMQGRDGEINCLVRDKISEDLQPYIDEVIKRREARQ